jgi:hypothetical protein
MTAAELTTLLADLEDDTRLRDLLAQIVDDSHLQGLIDALADEDQRLTALLADLQQAESDIMAAILADHDAHIGP